MLGAGVWEDVSGPACQSALSLCNLSLLAPPPPVEILHRISVPRFQASDFAKAHYRFRSTLQKISKRPGARDTSLGVNTPTEQIDC